MKKVALLLTLICLLFCFPLTSCGKENDIFEYSAKANGSYYISGINSNDVTSIEIPSTYNGKEITGIASNAFKDCVNLTSVIMPDTITEIQSYAFSGCSSLTNISISNNISEIENYAFENCDILEYYTYDNGYYLGNSFNNYLVLVKGIENSVESFVVNENCRIIYQNALSNFTNMKSLELPNTIENIGSGAFTLCLSLESFVIPSHVTSMSSSWFNYCSSLKTITLGANISEISIGYMSGCDSFEEFIIASTNSKYSSVDGVLYSKDKKVLQCYPRAKKSSNFSIPSYVETINTYAFNGCIYLESISMWSAVTKLNSAAVINCELLNTINYSGTMNEWVLLDNANSGWDRSKVVTKVVCSDGTISRSFS